MNPVSRKKLRGIERNLSLIFSKRGLVDSPRIEDFKADDAFDRSIDISGLRTVLLTPDAYSNFRQIVSTIHEERAFDGLADFSDIWTAAREALKDCISRSVRPAGASGFVSLIEGLLNPKICSHRFVVLMFGLEFQGVTVLTIGTLRVLKPSIDFIESQKVQYSGDHLDKFVEHSKNYLWLTGTADGTEKVAKQKFREKAQLATGMLAIIASSLYEHGAHKIRIGVVWSPEEAYGRAQYLSWTETDRYLSHAYQGAKSQLLPIDDAMCATVQSSIIGKRAFSIIESRTRTDLEDAIVKSVHWFSDAHRDGVPVMRLLKYWSCVEVFFSGDKSSITKSVSVGLAASLVHGGLSFVAKEKYSSFKARIASLYGLRSQATHSASYNHVALSDVAELSQWVSWLIITAITFTERGVESTDEMTRWSRRVAQHQSSIFGLLDKLRRRVQRWLARKAN